MPSARELVTESEQCVQEVSRLARSLTPAQASWQPAPGRWSVAQNVNHLAVTNEQFLRSITRALRGATGFSITVPRVLESKFIAYIEPPIRGTSKAPAPFRPEPQPDLAVALQRYRDGHRQLAAAISTLSDGQLTRTRIPHPMSDRVTLHLDSVVRIILAHDRRHLCQMEQVTAAPGFPR